MKREILVKFGNKVRFNFLRFRILDFEFICYLALLILNLL